MALGDPIPPVSDNDLILTDWGNAVAAEVNNSVKKTAAQTIAGPLTVTGTITANNRIVAPDAPTLGTHLTNKTYVDTNFVQVDGGNFMSGSLNVGGNPYATNSAGSFVGDEGQITTHVTATAGGTNTTANLVLDRTGASTGQPAAVGGRWVSFLRHGVAVGTITVSSAPGVAYNETSDYRLKDVVGEVDDPLGVIEALQPRRLAWKSTGEEFDGFIAHEVQAAAPQAVTGVKDAVLSATDPHDPGGIDPQQLDTGRLVVYLVGAVQQLAARVAELEAG